MNGGPFNVSIRNLRREFALTGKIPPTYSAPATFGRFEVLHQVGAGVLGPVFLARDPERTQSVAVKVFRLDITPEQAAELAAQLAMLARAHLAHPSIVAPFEAGIEGTVAYLAEDYVAADSLDAAIRQYGPAPISQAIRILAAVAGALDFAAAAGVYHGALHPRDLLVTPDDTRVTGLGIGRALETVGLRAPMRRPYVAPERVQREGWDARADIYSLGVLARELLIGRPKPDGSDARLPDEQAERLHPVLARATAARPADRFSTCLELIGAVQSAVAGTPLRVPAAAPVAVDGPPTHVAKTARPGAHDLLLPLEGDENAEADEPPVGGAGRLRLEEADAAPGGRLPSEVPPAVAPLPDLDLRPAAASDDIADSFDLSDLDSQMVGQPGPDAGELPTEQEGGLGVAGPPPFDRVAALSMPGPRTAELGEPVDLALPEDDVREPEQFADVFTTAPEPVAAAAEPIADEEPPMEIPAAPQRRPATEWRRPAVAPGRQSRTPALVAMLVVGLIFGAIAGYLMGARQSDRTIAPTPSGSTTQPAPSSPSPAAQPATSVAQPPANLAARPRTTAAAPSPAAVTGVLFVRSTPRGAAVAINGRARGTTPVRIRDLAAGRYTVRVSRRGYTAEEREVVVSAERPSSTITFSLDRATRAQPESRDDFFGSLSVESLPSGARVFVDGRLIGTSPVVNARIAAGSHVLRVDRTGFRPWTTPIQIVTGQRLRQTASLEREPR